MQAKSKQYIRVLKKRTKLPACLQLTTYNTCKYLPVRSLPRMPSHMHFKTTHLIEMSIADTATIWLFSSVLSKVNDQTTLLIEASATDFTTIRLFTCMTPHVNVEIAFLHESFRTKCALIGLFAYDKYNCSLLSNDKYSALQVMRKEI